VQINLDAVDAVELDEMLGFLSDWLTSDSNRLDASLDEFVSVGLQPPTIASGCCG
jgi:hypothetical protein